MRIEKLIPAYKDNLWGGVKLKERYGKKTDLTPCAEAWELSFHPDGPTTLADDKPLSEAFSASELGHAVICMGGELGNRAGILGAAALLI